MSYLKHSYWQMDYKNPSTAPSFFDYDMDKRDHVSDRKFEIIKFAHLLGTVAASQVVFSPGAGIDCFPYCKVFKTFSTRSSIATTSINITTVEGYQPH